jgi:8-oxo-dGTP pyrophosphatase MutT (NUDIX family)
MSIFDKIITSPLISRIRVIKRHTILRILYYFGYNTFAARALIIKGNKILLIKHSYQPGWHIVGGGIDRGETPVQAVKRELLEELGLKCLEEPKIFGIYYNNYKNGNDFKVIYVVKKFNLPKSFHNGEISEARMFDMKKLPKDIHQPTLRRIEEYMGLRKMDEMW